MTKNSEDIDKYYQIIRTGLNDEHDVSNNPNSLFAYYTSAESAFKIIKNKEIWFRNANVMNDFSEIAYGLEMIRIALNEKAGEKFRQFIDGIFPGTIEITNNLLSKWRGNWLLETYISCVSAHDPKENRRGRLSMWRAYGDTALIVKSTPMRADTDALAVFSIPVQYMSKEEFAKYLSGVANSIQKNRDFLISLSQDRLVRFIHHFFMLIAISTKHPGFMEEKEWRLYYRPTDKVSPGMTEEIVVVKGVPQKVYKLRLANEPEIGLYADIPSLLDRVIIGPTAFPYVSYRAFVGLLEQSGVEDASQKVVVSDIPLRVG